MKFQELSTKSEAELHKELSILRGQVAELIVKLRLQQAKNSHQLTAYRRDIARIMTVLSQKAKSSN
jgi:ribosomal protein L29